MKKSELKEIIQETVFDILTEKLCAKGQAYVRKRKAAGEKHGAYLMGRAVKVCKGQIKGENLDEGGFEKLVPGKNNINEAEGQVNVFGYQTKHFDVCPGAQSLYKRITDEKLKDDAIKSAKLQDALFALEKQALKTNTASKEDVEKAQKIADAVMKLAQRMGLKAEHQYIQGHVDKIREKFAANVVKEDDAMKKSALGMAMYGKKSKMDEDIDAEDGTEFKIGLKHLLKKHATNLKKGKADIEFKVSLKHLLDKHVSKGGPEKEDDDD
jgi:hypothetical protein